MNQIDINNTLKNLPELPGVYRFFSTGDIPLYIGKAKVLKNRVSSYFMKHRLDDNPRLQLMVDQIERIEYTVVTTENDALILEANLIHNLQPKFNILLKDDRNYLYVRITKPNLNTGKKPNNGVNYSKTEILQNNIDNHTIEDQNEFFDKDNSLYEVKKNITFIPYLNNKKSIPTVTLTRKKYDKTSDYFGPYTKKFGIFNILRILRTIFPYCEKKFVEGEQCQYVQIKQCDGICCGLESINDYNIKMEQIKKVLNGDTDPVVDWLKLKINEAVSVGNYELASHWRDKLNMLDEVISDQKIILPHPQNIDIITLLVDKDADGFALGSIFVQNIRDGKIVNLNNFLLSGTSGLYEEGNISKESKETFEETFEIGDNLADFDIYGMCQNFLIEYYAQQNGDRPEILLEIFEN